MPATMAHLALQALMAVCCTAPCVLAAWRVRHRPAVAGWILAALVAGAAGATADLLTLALRQVDGAIFRAGCVTP